MRLSIHGGVTGRLKVVKLIPLTAGLPYFAAPSLAMNPDPHP